MKRAIISAMLASCFYCVPFAYASDPYTESAPLRQWEKTSFGSDVKLRLEMKKLWNNGYKSEYIQLAIQIITAEKIIDAAKGAIK